MGAGKGELEKTRHKVQGMRLKALCLWSLRYV